MIYASPNPNFLILLRFGISIKTLKIKFVPAGKMSILNLLSIS